jgi:hypothetical protein
VVLFGEIDGDVGDLFELNLLSSNPGVCGHLSAPAEPNAGFALECSFDSNFKPPGPSFCIFLGYGNSIRDYDKLPHWRSSQRH